MLEFAGPSEQGDHAPYLKDRGNKGASAAMVLVPIEAPFSAAEIREKLTESAIEFGDRSTQF